LRCPCSEDKRVVVVVGKFQNMDAKLRETKTAQVELSFSQNTQLPPQVLACFSISSTQPTLPVVINSFKPACS
jgi:hypothetical protein